MVTKDTKTTHTPARQQAAQVNQTTGATEQVVVQARPLNPPVAQPKMGSTREVHDRHRKALAEGRARMAKEQNSAVNTGDAKIIPNIGQPRAQTSEEMRQDAEDSKGGVSQAAPYPGDPHEAHVKAILASERQRDSGEFNTEDLTGTSVDGAGETDVVKVRLLYDWWDGQGVRHPLNSEVELAMNDARNLLDQRKAERTDPLLPSRR